MNWMKEYRLTLRRMHMAALLPSWVTAMKFSHKSRKLAKGKAKEIMERRS